MTYGGFCRGFYDGYTVDLNSEQLYMICFLWQASCFLRSLLTSFKVWVCRQRVFYEAWLALNDHAFAGFSVSNIQSWKDIVCFVVLTSFKIYLCEYTAK